MKRIALITASLGAIAAFAAGVAAPALAGDADDPQPGVADIVACLRDHGLDAPDTTDALTLKQWIGSLDPADAAVQDKVAACLPQTRKAEVKPGSGAEGGAPCMKAATAAGEKAAAARRAARRRS